VNGDGYADIIIGVTHASNAGIGYVIFEASAPSSPSASPVFAPTKLNHTPPPFLIALTQFPLALGISFFIHCAIISLGYNALTKRNQRWTSSS